MTITTTLVPPSRGSAPATFSADMDAFLSDLPAWTTEANALESNVNAKEASATSAATTATTKAGEAATSASNAASSASTAATNATTAATQASNASSSATNAAASATSASNSASAAAASAASVNLATPGPIGSTTPNSGAFTTLAASGNVTLGDATTDTLNVGNGGIIKDASNNVGFGASPAAGQRFRVGGTLTGNINAYAQRNVVSVASDVTINALGYDSTISTDATSFTLTNLSHYYANQGTFGVGSAVTGQYGFRVASNMVGAANNYGFYGAIEAGSGRYNFYAAGTAQNSFSGDVLIHGAGGMGYTTGSGGTVTQATSRTTGVTINKTNGAITLVSAAGSTSWQSFTVTNSLVAVTDVVRVVQKSGTDKYMMHVTNVAAGSFQITFATTGGTTTEQPVFSFALIKGATS